MENVYFIILHKKNSIQNCIHIMNSTIQIYKVNGGLFLEITSCFRGIKNLSFSFLFFNFITFPCH